MKPIILIVGNPHSMTSMVAKFLLDNGGNNSNISEEWKLDYATWEDDRVQEFMHKRKSLLKDDINGYLNQLDSKEVVIVKAPLLAWFLNEIELYRPVRVVYVLRNPHKVMESGLEKSNFPPLYTFRKFCSLYEAVINCQYPVLPILAEKLQQTDPVTMQTLLEFCALQKHGDALIRTDGIIRNQRETKNYFLKWRISNFMWKRLNKLFPLY